MHEELLATAIAAARAGAEVVTRYFRAGDLEFRRKAENDFVTRADNESEAAILACIRKRFPDHRILAEEGGGSGPAAGEYDGGKRFPRARQRFRLGGKHYPGLRKWFRRPRKRFRLAGKRFRVAR